MFSIEGPYFQIHIYCNTFNQTYMYMYPQGVCTLILTCSICVRHLNSHPWWGLVEVHVLWLARLHNVSSPGPSLKSLYLPQSHSSMWCRRKESASSTLQEPKGCCQGDKNTSDNYIICHTAFAIQIQHILLLIT